jgi:hypothetical protein
MKIKSLFVAVLLMGGVFVAPAHANEKPTVESFTFSPQEIDVTNSDTTVNFELVVSHPYGISDNSTFLTLINSSKVSLGTYLTRTDFKNQSTRVTFKGALVVPRNVTPGVYTFSTLGVKNNTSAGYQYDSGIIDAGKVRALVGAESGLLVRSGGDLNFEYETFVGPSYDGTLGISYNNPSKYNSLKLPIWKVGETFDPSEFFELRVPSLSFEVSTFTPAVCSTNGKYISILKEGGCSFVISTPKTKDYLSKTTNIVATITSARIKPTLTIEKIANQDVKDLGKSIEIGRVYSASEGWVLPVSVTPSTCFANGFYVKLVAGGTCKLTYQTAANSNFLASDLTTVSFEILKDGQPVVVPAPVVTPTPTAKPVVKKTISCVKGKKTVTRTGTSPKCPAGYKLKK